MKLFPLVLAIPLVSGQMWLDILIPDQDPLKMANDAWQSFKNSAGKKYADELLENSRKLIFQDNLSFITSFNDLNATSSGFTLELNPFADLSPEEFRRNHFGFGGTAASQVDPPTAKARFKPSKVEVPEHVNWTAEGIVGPIEEQGECGACWAFSAAGTLEGQVARKFREHRSLSIQEFLDCSASNGGCDGGYTDVALLDLMQIGGIDSKDSYKYSGEKKDCKYSKASNDFEVQNVTVVEGDEELLKKAVAEIGPISVAIDANPQSLQFYKEGVYSSPECRPENINHAVLLVGYGTENGQPYWLIKNSWGPDWGEAGYLKLARNKDNHCGVTSYACFPVLKET